MSCRGNILNISSGVLLVRCLKKLLGLPELHEIEKEMDAVYYKKDT